LSRQLLPSNFDSIPSAVVECTKKLIIDQLGVMLAGSSAAGVPELVTSVREWGGAPEAAVLGGAVTLCVFTLDAFLVSSYAVLWEHLYQGAWQRRPA
jgi:2-methylcitrate dehydratase PrpD